MKSTLAVLFVTSFLCVGCASPIKQEAAAIATKEHESVEVSPDLFNKCSTVLPLIKDNTPDELRAILKSITESYVTCASFYTAQSRVIQKAFRLDSNGNPLK